MKLTHKQKKFVDEYLIDLNATQAAIRAGYSKKTAGSIGEENLKKPDIQNVLTERMKKREQRTEITQDMVLKELAKLAFYDVRKLYTPEGNLIPITQLDDDTAAAIAGIDVVEMAGGAAIGGDEAIQHVALHTKKLKLADKRAALVDVGKHLGMFKDRVELTGKDGAPLQTVVTPMTAEEYQKTLRLALDSI